MSTEPEGVESDSNADFAINASSFDYGMAQTSETLADPMSFQAQDLVVNLTGVERKVFVSARDDKDSLCNGVDFDAGSDLLKNKDKKGFSKENLKLLTQIWFGLK
ncbi:hypothetical protein AtEden1_Chr5g0084951 [Arabidopsis thaliana]